MDRLEDAWDGDERVRVSELLSRALDLTGLGGLVAEDQAALSLAEALGVDAAVAADGLLRVLANMLEPLEEALEAGPLDSWGDVETDRARTVASRAVAGASLDDIVASLVSLGRSNRDVKATVRGVHAELRNLLASALEGRLRKTFEVWRRRNVWPATFTPRRRPPGPSLAAAG